MTVTMIDTPGRLGNTSEPIDFTTTALVTSISVEYDPSLGTGGRETVWDGTADADNTGGDFSYLYRASTRSGSGPYSWTVRRTGRWPSDFRIRIKEATVGGDSAWTKVYEVDFTTLANQTVSAAGAYVFDGKTWYAKGLLTGLPFSATMSSALVNGSGLRITANDTVAVGSNAQYDGRFFAIPVTAFPTLQDTVPWAVRARFSLPTSGGAITAYIGLVDSTNDGASLLGGQRSGDFWIGNDPTTGVTTTGSVKIGTASATGVSLRSSSDTPSNTVYGVQTFNATQAFSASDHWDGSMPDMSGLKMTQQTTVVPDYTYTNKMIAFLMNNQTGTARDAFLTHLSIYQPKGA